MKRGLKNRKRIMRRNPATSEDFPDVGTVRAKATPQTKTDAFKRWFNGSVVVNRDGTPMVMYHGTGWTNIREFRSPRSEAQIAGFFAFDPELAEAFAMQHEDEKDDEFELETSGSIKRPSIYPVYLSLKKVFDVRKKEDRDAIKFKEEPRSVRGWDWTDLEKPVYISRMKGSGFDGYIDFEDGSNRPPTGIAVFDSRNVKSAYGNRGTFDPTDPDIRNPKRQIKHGLRNPVKVIERTDIGRNIDFATIPNDAEAKAALVEANGNKIVGGRREGDRIIGGKPIGDLYGKARSLPKGTVVDLRIDIPTFNRKGVYVVTVHKPKTRAGGPGDVIGYENIGRVSDPVFIVGKEVKAIYEGRSAKFPVATVHGKFDPRRTIPDDIENWIPVGMDPKEHAFFYDKRTDRPVVGGKEAISVGNTVFVKGPVYGSREDFPNPRRNPVFYPKDDITFAAQTPTRANKDIAASRALWETPAFQKWFGQSKVRNLAGKPAVLYHGTCASGFTKFDPTKTREMGFHFGTSSQAKDFLKGCGTSRGGKPGIYPVYLSIQNPIFTPDVYSEDPTYFIEWLEKTNHIHEWFPDEDDSYYQSLNKLRSKLVEAKLLPGREGYDARQPIYKTIWGLLRKVVTRKGYDGVRYKNENEGNTDDPYNIAWIAFSPAQVKSATENRGTFNRRDPDLRNPLLYPPEQVRAYETEVQSKLGFPDQTQLGADLELQRHRQWNTEEFRKWFGDSVVTKPNGAPLLVYHGTCRAGFTKFDPTKTREMGFHFGTWAQAKDFVGGCGMSETPGVGPGVYPVYLSIQRALETPDLFSNIPTPFIRWIEKTNPTYKWFTGSNDPYFKKLKYLEHRGAMAIYRFSGKSTSELGKFLKINNKKLWNHLKAIVMRKGYDGIRYKNESEGNIDDPNNIAWIAFSPAQVKSATDNRGTFNRRDAALDNPAQSMIRTKLSRIIEPGDRILCYDRAQGEDLYRLWDMIHTAKPLTKEALVEIEGMLDDDGVLVIESGEEPPGLRDHFRKVIKYGGMLLVQGPMNPEEARISTEKLRRELE